MTERRSRRDVLSGAALTVFAGSAATASAQGLPADDARGLPFRAGWRGDVPRTVADRLRDSVSILDFIPVAEQEAIRARTSTADLASYFTAAIAHMKSVGGGELYIPAGRYRCGSTITLCNRLHLRGAGKASSHIQFTHSGRGVPNGSGFKLVNPSNGSTSAYTKLSDLWVEMTHSGNAGACFYDNCSTFVTLRDCIFAGGKYGVVFDQTEVSGIYSCDMGGQSAGGAGLWIVNGGDITSGNQGDFTNQITVDHNCQFNQATHPGGSGAYAILDDGGQAHYYGNNNINGGGCRFAGCSTLTIMGGEIEAVNYRPTMTFAATTLAGNGVGGCSAVISNCLITQPSLLEAIRILSMNNLSLHRLQFSVTAAAACVTGVNNLGTLFSRQCVNIQPPPLFDTYASGLHDDGFLVVKQFGGTAHTLSSFWNHTFYQTTNASPVTITLPAEATEAIPIGANYRIEQFGAGPIRVAGARGVAVNGTLTTAAQYQVLELVKTAKNRWVVSRRG